MNMIINEQKKQKILSEIASGKLTKTEIARQNGITRDAIYKILKREKQLVEQERLANAKLMSEDILRQEIEDLQRENQRLKNHLIFIKSMVNHIDQIT